VITSRRAAYTNARLGIAAPQIDDAIGRGVTSPRPAKTTVAGVRRRTRVVDGRERRDEATSPIDTEARRCRTTAPARSRAEPQMDSQTAAQRVAFVEDRTSRNCLGDSRAMRRVGGCQNGDVDLVICKSNQADINAVIDWPRKTARLPI
jgi:hypothetical protein